MLTCNGAVHSVGSPPPCGEGLGVGVGRHGDVEHNRATPLPSPPPQGGGVSRPSLPPCDDHLTKRAPDRSGTIDSVAAGCRRLGRLRDGGVVMRSMWKLECALMGLLMLISAAPVRAADTVVIGTVGSASANLWPLFIGLDKGFFAAENVKPDLVYVPASAAVIQQLAAGSLDMTMSTGIVDPLRAIDQGAALAILRFEVQAPPYALMGKPDVKSLKDLKG